MGLLCFLPILQLSAQLDTFDLSKYKLPDIKRRQLDFNFSSTLNQARDNAQEAKNFTASGNIVTNLQTYTNNRKYQGDFSLQLNIDPDIANQTLFNISNKIENKSHSFNSGINISSTNRFFLIDKFFIETDINAGLANNTLSNQTLAYGPSGNLSTRTDFDHAQPSGYLSGTIIIGDGRIEPVEDARLAVYILDDLQKINKLVRIPTNEEILEFSSLISQLKNKRYFDYRLHKIEELKAIDSFLRDKGLVKENDIACFSVVNDNWDYSSGPARSAGSKFYAGLSPNIYLTSAISHSTAYDSTMYRINYLRSNDNTSQIGLSWLAGYIWEKPLDLYWQMDYGATVVYTSSNIINKDLVTPNTQKSRYNQISPYEYFNIGYYPNSRTYFSAGINLHQAFYIFYNWNSTDNTWPKATQNATYSASLNLNFYYYLSPQLRLNDTWNLGSRLVSDKILSTSRNSFYQNLNIGFIYSIF
jgi:hypothetical protein